MDIDKLIMQGKAYGMVQQLKDNHVCLCFPVVIKITKCEKFATRQAALYTFENESGVCWHFVQVSYKHNLTDSELFDTLAHELLHANDLEEQIKNEALPLEDIELQHTDKFWAQHDKIMLACGLSCVSDEHKEECKAND